MDTKKGDAAPGNSSPQPKDPEVLFNKSGTYFKVTWRQLIATFFGLVLLVISCVSVVLGYTHKAELKTQSDINSLRQDIAVQDQEISYFRSEMSELQSREIEDLRDCLEILESHTEGETADFFHSWKVGTLMKEKAEDND